VGDNIRRGAPPSGGGDLADAADGVDEGDDGDEVEPEGDARRGAMSRWQPPERPRVLPNRRPRWQRTAIGALKAVLAAGVVVVSFVVLAGAVLYLTTPDPRPSPGWALHTPMPSARGEVASVAAGGRLHVAGGLSGLSSVSSMLATYDPGADQWEIGPDLPAPRHHAAMGSVAELVVVTGGVSGLRTWTAQTDAWALDTSEADGEWSPIERLPEGRYGHAAVGIGASLVVVGGEGGSDDTLVWQPVQGWSRRAPIPVGRDHLAAAQWNGEVWVLGGRSGGSLSDRVDIYAPSTDTWRRGPALPKGMSAMAVGVLDGPDGRSELHVVGGEKAGLLGGVIRDHYVLRLGSSAWLTSSRSALPVHGAGFGVIGGRLLLGGGASRHDVMSVLSWTTATQSFSPDDAPPYEPVELAADDS